jgi:alpha-L-rhamnosidase
MIENGATTIWELWNGNTADPNMNSQNHVMLLGDLLTWFYENLAGIRTDKTGVGFKKIIMKPCFPQGLSFVNASYNSVHGMIKSEWKKTGNTLEWKVVVPANTTALLYVPARSVDDITEAGKTVSSPGDAQVIKWENNIATIQIGSGEYHFTSQLN